MQAIWTISQVILPIVRFGKLPLIWTRLADDIGSARGQDHEASEAGDHKDRILGGIPLGAVSHRGRCKHSLPASTPPPPLRDWIRLKTLRKGIQNPLPCKPYARAERDSGVHLNCFVNVLTHFGWIDRVIMRVQRRACMIEQIVQPRLPIAG